MPSNVRIGCCGWSYLRPREFREFLRKNYSSTLQAYAQLLDVVEINSTFYRLPKLSTAEKWVGEAGAVNDRFEFTVKAYQGITHWFRFGVQARPLQKKLADITQVLNARVVLFQTPASFKNTAANIKRIKNFFGRVQRSEKIFAWEPRGDWYDEPHVIADLCGELDLVHCVDPFRNEPLCFSSGRVAYFRLHGFGKPSMYRYNFSEKELLYLKGMISKLPNVQSVYVFFNNMSCHENALTFFRLL